MRKMPENELHERGVISALGHRTGGEVPVPGGKQQDILKRCQSQGGIVKEFFGSFQ